jgi:hypothetical protein
MERIYFYKLTADTGGAPCVEDGLLSLAICKPMIRMTANPGNLIFGFAASSLHRDNRLLYIARVTEKVSDGDYYKKRQFAGRGDRVYEYQQGRFVWRRGALHHGPKDVEHDLGKPPHYRRANVLLSDDFRYFGANGTSAYKAGFPLIEKAIKNLGRGHRVRFGDDLRGQLLGLKRQIWSETRLKMSGRPSAAPSRRVRHRSKSCGVLA